LLVDLAAQAQQQHVETLGQVGIFENLKENLPARAARENLRRFACQRAVSEKI